MAIYSHMLCLSGYRHIEHAIMKACTRFCSLRHLVVTFIMVQILLAMHFYHATLYPERVMRSVRNTTADNDTYYDVITGDKIDLIIDSETMGTKDSSVYTLASMIHLPRINLTHSLNIRESIEELQTLVRDHMVTDPPDFNISDGEYVYGIEVPENDSVYYKSVLDMCKREETDRRLLQLHGSDDPESLKESYIRDTLCPCIPDNIRKYTERTFSPRWKHSHRGGNILTAVEILLTAVRTFPPR